MFLAQAFLSITKNECFPFLSTEGNSLPRKIGGMLSNLWYHTRCDRDIKTELLSPRGLINFSTHLSLDPLSQIIL